ncbi:MAG: DUF3592 domain-containing protein [Planctomycetaceae bacterium]
MKTSLLPRIFGGGFFILLGVGAYVVFGGEMLRSQRCTATTTGELALSYTVNEKSRDGVVTSRSYDVNYSFDLDGRQYQGEETLATEPTDVEVTVRYNPENPEESELRAKNNIVFLLIGTGMLAIGVYVAFFERAAPELNLTTGRGVPPQPARPKSTADIIAAARAEAAASANRQIARESDEPRE